MATTGTLEGELAALAAGEASLLIIVAHPDDDVIGAGALLARTLRAAVAYVTDGAPRDGADARAYGFADPAAYAAARRREAEAALARARVEPSRIVHLGFPDQGATFALERVAGALEEIVEALRPDLLLTHPYEGGHPDHDATAFATHAAVARWRARRGDPQASGLALGELTSYHAGEGGVRRGEFLADPCSPETVVWLDDQARRLKAEMLACHATQAGVVASFPLDCERFRRAPAYDFLRAPHPGALLYERPDSGATWGIDGARWRAAAAEARRRLRLP